MTTIKFLAISRYFDSKKVLLEKGQVILHRFSFARPQSNIEYQGQCQKLRKWNSCHSLLFVDVLHRTGEQRLVELVGYDEMRTRKDFSRKSMEASPSLVSVLAFLYFRKKLFDQQIIVLGSILRLVFDI